MDSQLESFKKQLDDIKADVVYIRQLLQEINSCLVEENMDLSESDTETDEDEPIPKRPTNVSKGYNARKTFGGKQ